MSGLINVDASALVDTVKGVIDRVWPDKSAEEKARLADELQRDLANLKVDEVEAAQPGPHFRDGAGWVCVGALALNSTARPVIEWAAALMGHPTTLPALDISQLWTMLMALLGLSGMHVYQQTKQ